MSLRNLLQGITSKERHTTTESYEISLDENKRLAIEQAEILVAKAERQQPELQPALLCEALALFASAEQYYSMMLMGILISNAHFQSRNYILATESFEKVKASCQCANPQKIIEPYLDIEVRALVGLVFCYAAQKCEVKGEQSYRCAIKLFEKIRDPITRMNLEDDVRTAGMVFGSEHIVVKTPDHHITNVLPGLRKERDQD